MRRLVGIPPILFVLFLVLSSLYSSCLRDARGPTNRVGINHVTVIISPRRVPNNSPTVVTVEAYGYTLDPTPLNYRIEILDDEFDDDLLDDFITDSTTDPGVNPVLLKDPNLRTEYYVYTIRRQFILRCEDGDVVGNLESSGESDPEIFARLTVLRGDPDPTQETARVTVRCVEEDE